MRLLGLVVIAGACASAPHRAGARFPDDTFVLLDPAARFFVETTPGGDSFTLSSSEVAALRQRAAGAFRAFRLVSEDGDWLELETPGKLDDHCASAEAAFAPFRLRLFVHSADRLRVTTRQVRVSFGDGTAATLLPGAAVVDGRAWVDQVAVGVALPAGAVGTSYRGGGWLETPPAESYVPWRSLSFVTVGGSPLRAAGDGRSGPVIGVYGTRAGVAGTVAILRTRCAELEVLLPPGLVKPMPPAAGVTVEPKAPGSPRARAGATIYWPSGRVAGQLREDVDFLDAAAGAHGRRCFRWAPRERRRHADGGAVATFCFDAVDVVE